MSIEDPLKCYRHGEFTVKVALTRMRISSDGATAIEHALICALIAVVIVIGVGKCGAKVLSIYSDIANRVSLAI